MGNDKVVSLATPAVVEDALTELLRTAARRLIEAAVAAEFEECLSGFADERLPDGRRRVVRNGHVPRREILTATPSLPKRATLAFSSGLSLNSHLDCRRAIAPQVRSTGFVTCGVTPARLLLPCDQVALRFHRDQNVVAHGSALGDLHQARVRVGKRQPLSTTFLKSFHTV